MMLRHSIRPRGQAVLPFFLGLVTCVANAQSQVQLYGIVDAGVRHFPNLALGEKRVFGIDDGIRNRFGLRINEALGDGLSAFVRLESSFRIDTGAQREPAKFWDDKAWIGLTSKRYGTLIAGRIRTPIDDMVSGTRFEAFGGYSLASSLGRTGKASDAWDNGVYYTSPDRAGFKGGIGVRPGEGELRRSWGAHMEYAHGPVDVVASYQVDGETLRSDRHSYNASATYAFGVAKLFGTYVRTVEIGDHDAGTASAATLGIQIPMPIGQLRASLRKSPNRFSKAAGDRSSDIDTTHIGIGYHYPLSKRTSINASLVRQTRKTFDAAGSTLVIRRGSGYDIGVRHYF